MSTVYICSPLLATEEKTQAQHEAEARAYCEAAIRSGHYPIAPHLWLTQFLDDADPLDRAKGLHMALQVLLNCDEIWVCGERVSSGMAGEIDLAKLRGIPFEHVPPITVIVKQGAEAAC